MLSKQAVGCNETFAVEYSIFNAGSENEKRATVEIKNSDLGINIIRKDLSINSGNKDNILTRTENLRISKNSADGIYPLAVNVFSDDNKLMVSRALQLNVQKCAVEEEVKTVEEKGVSLVSSNLNLVTTETVERTIQIPIIDIFFKGSSRSMLFLLASTLILSIFFVLVAMILMAMADEEY